MQTVRTLIEQLKELPQDLPVYLLDYRRNLAGDDGEGNCGDGIYPITAAYAIPDEELPENGRKWAALEFRNPDYTDEGQYLMNA